MTLLLSLLIPTANAQECPPGAELGQSVPSGTEVTILGLARDDGMYDDRADYVGETGTTIGELYWTDHCFYGGQIQVGVGNTPYFYKVAVDAGGAARPWDQCPDSALYEGVRTERRYRVAGFHTEDSYSGGTGGPPIGGIVQFSAGPQRNGGCWWGGSIVSESDGQTYYVYKMAVVEDPDVCPTGSFERTLPDGPLRIRAIHAEGASELPVGSEVLDMTVTRTHADCWFSGHVVTDNDIFDVTRIALGRGGGGTRGCPTEYTRIQSGQRVRITSVHPNDPYAAVIDDLAGLEGRVQQLDGASACWTRGVVVGDNGVRLAFERALLEPVTDDSAR